MAPSSTFMLISLLVTFAVIAPTLPPSAASRDGGATKDAVAPAPSASGEAVAHPMGVIDDIIRGIVHLPDLPVPAIIPCPPAFPKIPLIPCYNYTPPPSPPPPSPPVTECRSTLVKFLPPCADFLASGSNASSPVWKCCDGIQPLFYGDLPMLFCYCHVINGDADKLLPTLVNYTRAANLMHTCGIGTGPDPMVGICRQGEEIGDIPPMDAPSPPPPRRH